MMARAVASWVLSAAALALMWGVVLAPLSR